MYSLSLLEQNKSPIKSIGLLGLTYYYRGIYTRFGGFFISSGVGLRTFSAAITLHALIQIARLTARCNRNELNASTAADDPCLGRSRLCEN